MPSACIVDAYVDGSSVQALNNKEKFKASDSFVSTAATILRILGLNSKAKNTASTRNNTKQKRQKSSKVNEILWNTPNIINQNKYPFGCYKLWTTKKRPKLKCSMAWKGHWHYSTEIFTILEYLQC